MLKIQPKTYKMLQKILHIIIIVIIITIRTGSKCHQGPRKSLGTALVLVSPLPFV